MTIEIEDNRYLILKDHKNAFNHEDFLSRYTDYFSDFDYIVGDIAYGKLRLKGFYDKANRKVKEYNNFANLNDYLRKFCANDCKYFILKRN